MPTREEIQRRMRERITEPTYEGLSPDVQMMVDENPDLGGYVTPEHNAAQATVIAEGLKAGVDVSKYSNPEYNYAQMNAILDGLKQGIDVTKYVDYRRNDLIIREVVRAIRDGLTDEQIKTVQRQHNWKQAMEVRLGFRNGIDANKYANPNKNSASEMERIRRSMEEDKKPLYERVVDDEHAFMYPYK